MRVWRALKSLGCAALRDGAYLLPATHEPLFDPIVADVKEHSGSAIVFSLASRDPAQRDELAAMFDRSKAYAQWRESATELHAGLESLDETEARRRFRAVGDALQLVQRTDYLAGAASRQAQSALDALHKALDARFSSGEPSAQAGAQIARLDPKRFQRKRWATRARPWVDRLACAWLIRRFIDREARFVWLADPARAPRGVLGFDYDGARFTHVGERVSFEVLVASFGLESDPRLNRIASVVHFLDVGGIPVAQAPGLETVLSGLQELHSNDDDLAEAAGGIFDALYAA